MKTITKLVVLLVLTAADATAQARVGDSSTDIAVGVSWTSLVGTESVPYASLGINVSTDPVTLDMAGLRLSATVMPTLSLGAERNGSPRFDHVQLPVGVRIRVRDDKRNGSAAVDGSVAGGLMLTFGRFNSTGADVRAFMAFDVGLGVFTRNGIRLRTLFSVGRYQGVGGQDIQYGGIYLAIASTGW
ncbi:MAG: hypothetical protein MUC47_01730 [Candidatus Kapabacteria bacterium]|jgi:hypothetical protein|nr:hypothetical protein [Candidatus Kapabacteria bacterium]